jgi:hypothetical protein
MGKRPPWSPPVPGTWGTRPLRPPPWGTRPRGTLVFCPFLRHFVLVFFDDILIYSKTWTTYLAHVDRVLHLLS